MDSWRILSFNVNGIRAAVRKGFVDFLKKDKPDFLCLQEIKISKKDQESTAFDFAGYQEFWNSAERPGYSGTAILVKDGIDVSYLPRQAWDNEGRVQVLDIGLYYLVNIYFPNANQELSRLDFKLKFNDRLLRYLKSLEKKKPLIICGDYNVAHMPIDLARPKENEGLAGYTKEERDWMMKFLKAGFVDTYRHLHPKKVEYTWWTFRANARARNVGWRIDYFCVSDKIMKRVQKAFILNDVHGSDHCPLGIEIKN